MALNNDLSRFWESYMKIFRMSHCSIAPAHYADHIELDEATGPASLSPVNIALR